MIPKWTARLTELASVHSKRILSFRKLDWELRDYPIRISEQHFDPAAQAKRLKLPRFCAAIINWWVMDGLGDTREEAIGSLRDRLDKEKIRRAQQGKALPRPGTHVPLEYASQDRIDKHRELSEDFIHRILSFERAWISDESSLWDFHADESNKQLFAKIEQTYGVDVSDIESGNLAEILDRIASRKPQSNN